MAKYSPSGSPPDVTACILWLKNRDPRHWRDSQQMEHVLGKYIISDTPMTEEERAQERATVLDAEPAFGDGREELHRDAATLGLPQTAPTPRKLRSDFIVGISKRLPAAQPLDLSSRRFPCLRSRTGQSR
jgi:hypothetical protein